jgi:hypothetical protein
MKDCPRPSPKLSNVGPELRKSRHLRFTTSLQFSFFLSECSKTPSAIALLEAFS